MLANRCFSRMFGEMTRRASFFALSTDFFAMSLARSGGVLRGRRLDADVSLHRKNCGPPPLGEVGGERERANRLIENTSSSADAAAVIGGGGRFVYETEGVVLLFRLS